MPILTIVGGAVVALGAVLWCGNVFGFFPTFPFAGYVTIAIGGAIIGAGKKMAAGEPKLGPGGNG